MSLPTEPRLNGSATANGDLVNRVQQLRLTDMPAAVRESEKRERAARVARADANRVRAKLELDRQKGLMARGTGSQQDLDVAQNNYDTAVAELELEKAMADQVNENSRKAQIDAA